MIKPKNNSNATVVSLQHVKKDWKQPELILIGSATINAKSHPSIKESTGSQFVNNGQTYVTNNHSLSFKGTIGQAVS